MRFSASDREPRGDQALQTVGRVLRKVRLLAAALVLVQLIGYAPSSDGVLGIGVPALVVLVVLVVGSVNVASMYAERRRGMLPRVVGVAEVMVDGAIVLLITSFVDLLAAEVNWALLVIPVLEGALRYRLSGAVVTWAVVACAYFVLQLQLGPGPGAAQDPAHAVEQLQLLLHRLGVVLLVAVPGGYLSQQLLFDITAQQRSRRQAARRSELLAVVARATQEVNVLDSEPLDAVLRGARRLGFDRTDVWSSDGRGGWSRLLCAETDAQERGVGFESLCEQAHQHKATMVARLDVATPQEQQQLESLGVHAVVAAPLAGQDGGLVLSVGLSRGRALEEAQVECVSILAAQAEIALQNGQLLAELRDTQEQLHHQAFHDPLTGLANRASFQLAVDVLEARAGSDPVGVLFLDLDRFKPVNDTHGHEVGDELLRAVAGRLKSCVRHGDLLSRLGGDEFTVLMRGGDVEADVAFVAQRICDTLTQPFELSVGTVSISTSVGIATDAGAVDAGRLIRRADAAMYEAKASGRGRWCLHPGGDEEGTDAQPSPALAAVPQQAHRDTAPEPAGGPSGPPSGSD